MRFGTKNKIIEGFNKLFLLISHYVFARHRQITEEVFSTVPTYLYYPYIRVYMYTIQKNLNRKDLSFPRTTFNIFCETQSFKSVRR